MLLPGSTIFFVFKFDKLLFFPQVRVREFYIAMQRCPYIHEMKERLLGAPIDAETKEPQRAPLERPLDLQDNQVGTIVKVSSCTFSSSHNCSEYLLTLTLLP